MNNRSKNIKKYYYLLHALSLIEYTYFINDDVNNTISTEFYFGNKEITKIPVTIDGMTVTELSPTTFCSKTYVTEVKLNDNIISIG